MRPAVRHPKYKTEKCKSFWATGTCRYGIRCKFLHNESSKISPENDKCQSLQQQPPTVQFCFQQQPQQQTQCLQITSPQPYIEQIPSPNIPMAVQFINGGGAYYPEADYEYNQQLNPSSRPVMRKLSVPERPVNAYTWDQVRKVSSPSVLSQNQTISPTPVRVPFMLGRKNNLPSEALRNYIPYSDNEYVNDNMVRKSTWNGEIVYDSTNLSDRENRKSTWPITKSDEEQLNQRFASLNVQYSNNLNYYENDDNCNRLPVFTKLSGERSISPGFISSSESNISETTCCTINSPSLE